MSFIDNFKFLFAFKRNVLKPKFNSQSLLINRFQKTISQFIVNIYTSIDNLICQIFVQ